MNHTKKTMPIFLGIFSFIVLSLFSCSSNENDQAKGENVKPVSDKYEKYFCHEYAKCRQNFRQLAQKWRKHNAVIDSVRVPSKIDSDLTIDYFYLPAQKKKSKIVVFSAGVHGIEGFMGSSVFSFFVQEILPQIDRSEIGFLFLHGINPYGFKFKRRVTENNVDLNRNSDVDPKLFTNKNTGYNNLYDFLNPKEKADLSSFEHRFFFVRSVWQIIFEGMSSLRQAILQGQYEHAKGLYFGGKAFEPSIKMTQVVLKKYLKDYQSILGIDLHTGYGERGRLHLFSNPVKDAKKKKIIESLFLGYSIDWGDSADFYTVTGDFSDFVGKIYPEKYYIAMPFEYGTMDSQTTSGSIDSIHNMILENQGHHFGYAMPEDKKIVQNRVLNMYFPQSKWWRYTTMKQTDELLHKVMARWQKTQLPAPK